MLEHKLKTAGILGTGKSIPEKVLSNFDLEKMVDTSDEWITQRTGISERRIIDNNMPLHQLGIEASRIALKDAGIKPEDLDLIIVTTETPDYMTPSMSCLIQKGISAANAAAFDLNAACTGFVYALTVANQFIQTGYYKYILIVCCEALSRVVDWQDRSTCVLFGDAAGAVVVGPVDRGSGIIATHIGADGNLGHNITIPCCYINQDDINKRPGENKRTIRMDGSEVFRFAVRVMVQATEKVLEEAGLSMDDIKLVIPHQANIRIIDGASKRLEIDSNKVYANVHKYGNTSSASIPIALDEAAREGLLSKGDNIILVGFGGGLTWASALINWVK
ncbi:MAG TPA: ketoacyl-ACP synthase III [Clostridiaceae bacterium]|jgi:3-oxoacyl-[acyl-carrier-protein] synthase-3|nr:ketoacyl-ACP synthase III [Clostridiaceae bacterium]